MNGDGDTPRDGDSARDGDGPRGGEHPPVERQHVERVRGSRRARLTPVEGTDPSPETGGGARDETQSATPRGPRGPNDDRLMQDVPPHY